MRIARYLSSCLLLSLGFSTACQPEDKSIKTRSTPQPLTGGQACIISADCATGLYCDLGECIQQCNTATPCAEASAECSARARCMPAGESDHVPEPTTTYLGQISAEQTNFALTGADSVLNVKLKSSSAEKVRYRIQVNAPYLSIDKTRGEFTGSTTLAFKVDPSKIKGQNATGSIQFFTPLGGVIVTAPIHLGVTGSYAGLLRYNGGKVNLGDTRIALDLLEQSGAVSIRVDAKQSLLFPAGSTGSVTGTGAFTESDGIDATITQFFDKDFGGAQNNHFQRDIGRKLRLKLKPASRDHLEGTFEDTIYGLFSRPVTLTGSVILEYLFQDRTPLFTVAEAPPMPTGADSSVFLGPKSVFGWDNNDCASTVCGSPNCGDASSTKAKVLAIDTTYYGPLQSAMTSPTGSRSSRPFQDLATACEAALDVKSVAGYTGSARSCALIPPLACTLPVLAHVAGGDPRSRKAVRVDDCKNARTCTACCEKQNRNGIEEFF